MLKKNHDHLFKIGEDMKACFQNNFMEDNVKILTFQMNSCLYISSIYIDKKTKFI